MNFYYDKLGICRDRPCYKVTMKAGELTRSKWVRNEVQPNWVVKDADGRLFRVKSVEKVGSQGLQTTILRRVR